MSAQQAKKPHLRVVHPLERDINEARKFLECLDPTTDVFTFQTAADPEELKSKGALGRTIHGRLEDVWDELCRANDQGYGIHVTVNATKGTRRKKKDVTRVRAVWCENDKGSDARNYPREPSVTVWTSCVEGKQKRHDYFLLDANDQPPFDEFAGVMDTMVESWGCDVGAKDLSRPLRLPGTFHMKGVPQLVTFSYPGRDGFGLPGFSVEPKRYPWVEILAAFPPTAPDKAAEPEPVPEHANVEARIAEIRSALKLLPASCGRAEWLRVLMGIKHDVGEAGREVAEEWSATCEDKFDKDVFDKEWDSLKRTRGDGEPDVTAATIFKMARDRGWPGHTADPDAEFGDLPKDTAASADRPILKPGDPMPSATALLGRRFTRDGQRLLHCVGGDFLGWRDTHYRRLSEKDVKAAVWMYLDGADKLNTEGKPVRFAPNKNNVDNVVSALEAQALLESETTPPAWLDGSGADLPPPTEMLPCANGLLHIPSRTLRPHTPAFLCCNALPYDYQPSAPEPKHWRTFLQAVWGDDAESIETLQEWFGYALTLDTRFQKIMFLHGEKRTGKGTVSRILRALIGPSGVAGPTLSSLAGPFGYEFLIDRQLAVISDARLGRHTNTAALLERLLSVSGEDAVTVDRKHRTSWHGRLTTRFMILSNDIPELPDSSGAFASRCIVLHFPNSFYGREDLTLEAKLTAELPGILNWSLEGLGRLLKRGHVRQPESAKGVVDELHDLANPVAPFVREECELGPDKEVDRDILYLRYAGWCLANGQRSAGNAWFGRRLRAIVPGLDGARPGTRDSDRSRLYTGIGLVSPL